MHTSLLKRLRSESGAATVEMVIFAPVLMIIIGIFVLLWDAFRTANLSLYASYTVADSLSRERNLITDEMIDELGDLYAFLNKTSEDTGIRVTVLQRELNADGKPETVWKYSHATNPEFFAATTSVDQVAEHVPLLALGSRIYITEAVTLWEPFYITGVLEPKRIYHVAATPPRFSSPLTKKEQDDIAAAAENPDDEESAT